MSKSKGSKGKHGGMAALAREAAALEAIQGSALQAFGDLWPAIQGAQDAVTQEMYIAFRDVYKTSAWKLRGWDSAADMLRFFAQLPEDTAPKDPRLVKQVNFSNYVRKLSPWALAELGKTRGGKAGKVTVERFQEYAQKAVKALAAKNIDPVAASKVYQTVLDWYRSVLDAHPTVTTAPAPAVVETRQESKAA